MKISSLTLQNFRNHSKKIFSFSPNTTIVLGSNGSGKTNILEGIFILTHGKSFRADSDREVISFEKEMARVKVEIEKLASERLILEVILTNGQVHGVKTPYKRFEVNGVGRRMLDFVGNLKVVLFWPQDIELVTESPSLRRRYLDFVLSQVDREYRRSLNSYERGVRQRNRLLERIRDFGGDRRQLFFWDNLLIKDGEYITKKREEYISFLNNSQFSIFLPLRQAGNFQSNYQLQYDASIISHQRLEQYKEQEVASAMTLVGPHRDDFKFKILNSKFKTLIENNKDLASYGSRGEQRLGILWLKLGELEYVQKQSGERPVLLLDDIFSELDHPHRDIIFELIGKQQTILTVADEHFIDRRKLKDIELIEL